MSKEFMKVWEDPQYLPEFKDGFQRGWNTHAWLLATKRRRTRQLRLRRCKTQFAMWLVATLVAWALLMVTR